MCPVHWGFKNQRTAHAVPIVDILCRVGISVCLIVTASTDKGGLLAIPEGPTAMAALTRVGRRYFCYGHPSEQSLVGDKVLRLEERPVVPILACKGWRLLWWY